MAGKFFLKYETIAYLENRISYVYQKHLCYSGLRQSQAISNLTKIKNLNFKIQMPNEIQMSKCQNIKSVSSEIVRE
ncbi:hypothetical protein DMNBHIDG_00218 [Candidatus Methanoperedenaceae archaeon GB37]|nr:hypothetical protein DMNBHIDG_00218 [Candidatus Methanoperedenaceae archaeon GB37]